MTKSYKSVEKENEREDNSRSNSSTSTHNRLMASVSRMRSNEPIEISSDETNDSDENDDQLDRENDSFGKFLKVYDFWQL